MPKLGNRSVSVPDGKSVEVKLYYIAEEATFVAVPPSEYLLPGKSTDLIKSVRSRGKYYEGTTGTTEQQAINNMNKYMKEFAKVSGERTKYIYIHVDPGEERGWERQQRSKTEEEIKFQFTIGYSMKLPSGTKHFKDQEYEGTNAEIWNGDSNHYTRLPWSQNLQDRCEEIVRQLRLMKQLINKQLSDAESAQRILMTSNLLTLPKEKE